jgi:small subunit ribosomal protein S6
VSTEAETVTATRKNEKRMPNYETVFILTPVLSEERAKEAVGKFRKLLKDCGANILHEEDWGLRKSGGASPQKKTGYYHLIEFEAAGSAVADLELALKRDERVLRFMTVRLDKHALKGNARARFDEWLAGEEGTAADASKGGHK